MYTVVQGPLAPDIKYSSAVFFSVPVIFVVTQTGHINWLSSV